MVIRSPPQFRRVFWLSAAILVPAAFFVAAHWKETSRVELRLTFAVLLTGLVMLAIWVGTWRHFELGSKALHEFWRGRLRRSFALEDLIAVERRWGNIILTFREGKVRINPHWLNAASCEDQLSQRLDARAPTTIGLIGERFPLRYLRFPWRCVGCGGRPTNARSLLAGWVIHVHYIRYEGWSATFDVPICQACSQRRKAATAMAWVMVVLIWVFLFLAVVGELREECRADPVIAALLIGSVLLLPSWLYSGLRKHLDFMVLGVRGSRYWSRSGEVGIVFRYSELEMAVRAASHEAYRKAVGERI